MKYKESITVLKRFYNVVNIIIIITAFDVNIIAGATIITIVVVNMKMLFYNGGGVDSNADDTNCAAGGDSVGKVSV